MFGVGMGVRAISLHKTGEWRREEVGFGGGTGRDKEGDNCGGQRKRKIEVFLDSEKNKNN